MPPEGGGFPSVRDGAGGALVDAGAAVDAFAGVDDGDVLTDDRTLGADIDASSASHTLRSVNYCCHCSNLGIWTDEMV